jgi:branched-chain amino acid transport system substrate-binding protein
MPDRTRRRVLLALAGTLAATSWRAFGQDDAIRIGVPVAVNVQAGRDAVDAMRMATDAINARGGVLGRPLELVVADETQSPQGAIEAIHTLTAQKKVDVLIGGSASGITLAQLPHIVRARTIYLGIGAASPAITQRVGTDEAYRYVFRAGPMNASHQALALLDFVSGFVVGEMGWRKVVLLGEDAPWVHDLLPVLAAHAGAAGAQVTALEALDPASRDFMPLLTRTRDSQAQFLVLVVSRAASDVLVEQWHDAHLPFALGGVDVKSTDADFYRLTEGKAISQITGNLCVRAPITAQTIPFWDGFVRATGRTAPAYTAMSGYDAVHLYADAVARAGTLESDAVIAQLERSDFVGTQGRLQFDANHDLKVGPGLVRLPFVQWQAGGSREVVWPSAMRTARPILPPWMNR